MVEEVQLDEFLGAFEPEIQEQRRLTTPALTFVELPLTLCLDTGDRLPDETNAPFDGKDYLLLTRYGPIVGRWVARPGTTCHNEDYEGYHWLVMEDNAYMPLDAAVAWCHYDPANWQFD